MEALFEYAEFVYNDDPSIRSGKKDSENSKPHSVNDDPKQVKNAALDQRHQQPDTRALVDEVTAEATESTGTTAVSYIYIPDVEQSE